MSVSIVVARYTENIEWTKEFPNVIVYNKGEELNDGYNEISLPNVGREGHTYYKHIIDNYDNLADYTIFLQGSPFDHSPNIISTLHKYNNSTDLNIDFEFVSEHILMCNLDWCKYHGFLPLRNTYNKLFNEDKGHMEYEFGIGAQFIVSKKRILKRPKEFYAKIVELLEYDVCPIEGNVIERFHKLIFE